LHAELTRHFSAAETLAALSSSRSLAGIRTPSFALPAAAGPREIAAHSSQQLINGLTGRTASSSRPARSTPR
jgi:hypothetical protein